MSKQGVVISAGTPVEKTSQYGTSYMLKITMDNGDAGLCFMKDKSIAEQLYNKRISYSFSTNERGSMIKFIAVLGESDTPPPSSTNQNGPGGVAKHFELQARDRSIMNQVAMKCAVELTAASMSSGKLEYTSIEDMVEDINILSRALYVDILTRDPAYVMMEEIASKIEQI